MGGSGVEYGHFFISTLSIDCISYVCQIRAYHMHAKVNFCVKNARQIEIENCANDIYIHETRLTCFILNAISVTRF